MLLCATKNDTLALAPMRRGQRLYGDATEATLRYLGMWYLSRVLDSRGNLGAGMCIFNSLLPLLLGLFLK